MRKVVSGLFLSLDGVAESPDQFLAGWDDEMDQAGVDLIADQDAVVLGRRTYDEWAPFWPESDIEPFASFINRTPKHVATSSPLGDWANASAIEGDLVEFVRDLKAQDGGTIGVHGSISVTQALLAAGLVDELRFVIAPRVVGEGKRLFDGVPSTHLEAVRLQATPTGHLLADYRVVDAPEAGGAWG